MLKKITIAVLGLTASGLAIAGTMGPVCTPGNVTVPCAAKLWDLGVEALYLRSIFGAEKAYQPVVDPVTGTVSNAIKDIKNDWNWGYRLMGSYHFNTGNDVTVNWMHFSSTADQNNVFFGLIGPNDILSAQYNNRNRLDQVNVVMGQHLTLGMRDQMRFYAGMQYANIQSASQTYISDPLLEPFLGNPAFNLFDNTDYKGFGPTIGIDYSYTIFNGLSLTANGSTSLLYGTTRYHAGLVITEFNVIEEQIYASKKAIVPSLEAKLGLNYAYNMAQGVVNIDAGYQIVNYFNPLNAQTFENFIAPISFVNYGLYGPYFGLKYVGNA